MYHTPGFFSNMPRGDLRREGSFSIIAVPVGFSVCISLPFLARPTTLLGPLPQCCFVEFCRTCFAALASNALEIPPHCIPCIVSHNLAAKYNKVVFRCNGKM